MEAEENRLRLLFGRFLERAGVVSGEQVKRAMRLKKELTPSHAELALTEGLMTIEQLGEVRERQRQEALLFEEAVTQLGFVDEEVLQQLKSKQRERILLLGEVLVMQGVLTKTELEAQVAAFHDYHATSKGRRAASPSSGSQ